MILVPPALLQQDAPTPPAAPLRASYGWGYVGPEGEGTGTLNVLVDRTTGKVVMELHGLGERLLILEGDRASGYRVQIPRDKVDTRGATLADLPLPFLPAVGSPEALLRLMMEGAGPGISVQKKDAKGPVKMHYQGKDPKGRPEEVWLTRKVWQP
jgi:hypothetical protein